MPYNPSSTTKLDIIQYIESCVLHGGEPPTVDDLALKLDIKREVMAVYLSRYVRNGVLVVVESSKGKRYGIGENAFGELSGRQWREKKASGK